MQNEELLTIQKELEKSKKRYFDLYDMAPICYCTLDKNGFIEKDDLSAFVATLGFSRASYVEYVKTVSKQLLVVCRFGTKKRCA